MNCYRLIVLHMKGALKYNIKIDFKHVEVVRSKFKRCSSHSVKQITQLRNEPAYTWQAKENKITGLACGRMCQNIIQWHGWTSCQFLGWLVLNKSSERVMNTSFGWSPIRSYCEPSSNWTLFTPYLSQESNPGCHPNEGGIIPLYQHPQGQVDHLSV